MSVSNTFDTEEMVRPILSIITATFNDADNLTNLIESLGSQTAEKKDYEFIIIDGLSTDNTRGIVDASRNIVDTFISQADCGIYDAFNKGIHLARGQYYICAGSDDYFYPTAVENIVATIKTNSDFDCFVFSTEIAGNVRRAYWRPHMSWLAANHVVSAHSLGMVINKSLHSKLGLYDLEFKICADSAFIKKMVLHNSAVKIFPHFIIGRFSTNGISNKNIIRTLTETLIIQLKTENNKITQILFFIIRVIKNYRKI